MISDAVKIARITASASKRAADAESLRVLMNNPIIELLVGFALVEIGQRYPQDKPLFTGTQGNLMQAGIAGLITAQQIAPLTPALAQGGAALTSLLKLA